jgi:hypothetical protein
MKQARRPEPSLTTAQRTFHTVVVAVGGLYIATHSVVVTAIGTIAATALACWAPWLVQHRLRSVAATGQPIGTAHEQAAINHGDNTPGNPKSL